MYVFDVCQCVAGQSKCQSIGGLTMSLRRQRDSDRAPCRVEWGTIAGLGVEMNAQRPAPGGRRHAEEGHGTPRARIVVGPGGQSRARAGLLLRLPGQRLGRSASPSGRPRRRAGRWAWLGHPTPSTARPSPPTASRSSSSRSARRSGLSCCLSAPWPRTGRASAPRLWARRSDSSRCRA